MEEIKHKKEVLAFDKMLSLMEQVRNECPWDHAQTNDTLRTLTIEELYELSQAILDKNDKEICKELGDVMMHVVFYALIGKEKDAFDMTDVLNSLSEKLIRRHPHVFNKELNLTAQDVEKNWERIKLKEGNRSTFAGVPETLPSLIKAYRLQDKAKGIGFDWKCKEDVWKKVEEEINELKEEENKEDIGHLTLDSGVKSNIKYQKSNIEMSDVKNPKSNIEAEFGDVLFSLINYARFIDVNPDTALEMTNRKFKSRFEYMEKQAKENGKPLQDMDIDEMEALWQQAKNQTR